MTFSTSLRRPILAVLLFPLVFGTACAAGQPARTGGRQSATASAAVRPLGLDTSGVDRAVRPQDDLFRHANGRWLATTDIPADRVRYGTFDALREQTEQEVRAILEEVVRGGFADDPDAARVRHYYNAYLDSARAERLGAQPIRPDLERVAAIRSHADLPAYFAHVQSGFGMAPFFLDVLIDARRSSRYIPVLDQGGVGLPERGYYTEAQFADARDAYKTYVTRLYTLAGLPGETAAAETVLALETRLASHQWTPAQNRDRIATYNKVATADFDARHPNLGLGEVMRTLGLTGVDSVIVRQPSYFRALDSLVAATPLDTWKAYFRAHVLASAGELLSSSFVQADFDFWGQALGGQQAMSSRKRRATAATSRALGEALGRMFVARHFRPEAKTRIEALIQNLRGAFREAIGESDWMSPPTKAAARAKLDAIVWKVGYPERWRDYSTLDLRPDDLVGNVRRWRAFEYADGLARLHRPVDRSEWGMTPQTVNAYYSALTNEIAFPAAVLRPPLFDPAADDAANYGAIGYSIGHEFSNAFDDQGRKYDADGNLRDWWTDADAAEYTRRARRILDQYGAYEVLPGERVNGPLTLGENIADIAGLSIAYRAYRRSLHGQEPPVIGGLTGDQRFFLGYALTHRAKIRERALRARLRSDTHSPSEFRINGAVQHLDAFHAAFGTRPGDKMWRAPEDRVRIW
ncbi:MAG TPA: M13 family metallopeptidase [Rhodothermales bacterium]|nr:M13 family metallopeptidase [Rhodothermales bacterium]